MVNKQTNKQKQRQNSKVKLDLMLDRWCIVVAAVVVVD